MAKRSRSVRRAPKKAAPHSAHIDTPAPEGIVVTIRARDGEEMLVARVMRSKKLERLAREWAYILRERQRWSDDEDLRESLGERALNDLQGIVEPPDFMQRLASVNRVEVETDETDPPVNPVEVELHPWDPADDQTNRIYEAASEIPWEYLISAATRSEGRFHSILITRLFRNDRVRAKPRALGQVLFVESAPGRLQEVYGFESERGRIRAAVRADGAAPKRSMKILKTPQVSDLEKLVRSNQWEVIHVTGVDTHQATQFIKDIYDDLPKNNPVWEKGADSSYRVRDGMILREGNSAELPVNYSELARALVNPESPPYLVTLNLYYSGARTARELVKHGAHAALGFLDEIDDELAELFFQAFYWAWCSHDGTPPVGPALLEAWQKMGRAQLNGTAIVMWLGESVFEQSESSDESAEQAVPAEDCIKSIERHKSIPISKLLQVDFNIADEINYSLLHNDRALLDKLTLTKLVKEPLYDITVQVELNLGAENYPFRCSHLIFDEPQLTLGPVVKIPLTATLPRSLQERVGSTVYVKITCEERTIFETTERVILIPVGEWLDDGDRNPWLPSFVLPRDPAILKIINASRRYLVGINDDPAASFDGYQSVNNDDDDPSAGVDKHVQSVWTALVNEFRLQYINPPPAYSKQTQRLRTPGDVIASNTGTCIDLALLLASCLEYIDIYPVIVLLKGHAFVGYWRSEEVYDDFVKVKNIPPNVPVVGSQVARDAEMPYVEQYGWYLSPLNYDEIMAFVTAGDLVMLEATYLTRASSFADAKEEGRANLRDRGEFESLLDIRLARSATPPVTPLPIVDD